MKCPKCLSPVHENDHFCRHCGHQLERCPSCHHLIDSNDLYCAHCGMSLSSQTQEYYEPIQNDVHENETVDVIEEPIKEKVNKKALIMSIFALVIATFIAIVYLAKTSGVNPYASTNSLTETKDENTNSDSSLIANENEGGYVFYYKDKIYVSDQKQFKVYDKDFKNEKVLLEMSIADVNIQDDMIYYTDKDHFLCKMNLEGKDNKKLVNHKAYYVQVKGDKIYYQNDGEHGEENIYVYDLKINESKKLNDRHSYHLNIIDNIIYYTSEDGIYKLNIDDLKDELLLKGKYYSLVYQSDILYFSSDDNKVESYDIKTKKTDILMNNSYLLNINAKYLFAFSRDGLLKYNLSTKESQVILNAQVDVLHVINNTLFISDKNITNWQVIDFSGQSIDHFNENDNSNFV